MSNAKIGSLGHIENLVGQYILYAPDKAYASFLLMSLLLRAPNAKRVQIHNWLIAKDMTRSHVESFGGAIARLKTPLYPNKASLGSLNQQTLEAELQKLHGNGKPAGGSALNLDVTGAGKLPVATAQSASSGPDLGFQGVRR